MAAGQSMISPLDVAQFDSQRNGEAALDRIERGDDTETLVELVTAGREES